MVSRSEDTQKAVAVQVAAVLRNTVNALNSKLNAQKNANVRMMNVLMIRRLSLTCQLKLKEMGDIFNLFRDYKANSRLLT